VLTGNGGRNNHDALLRGGGRLSIGIGSIGRPTQFNGKGKITGFVVVVRIGKIGVSRQGNREKLFPIAIPNGGSAGGHFLPVTTGIDGTLVQVSCCERLKPDSLGL